MRKDIENSKYIGARIHNDTVELLDELVFRTKKTRRDLYEEAITDLHKKLLLDKKE